MTTLLADYENERRAFEALLQPVCQERILLLHGDSGSGKTTLIAYCQERVPQTIKCIPVQLRGNAVSVAEIFYRCGQLLTWERLPRLTEQVDNLQGRPEIQLKSNWIAGINNKIIVALKAENPADRDHRRSALTNAWFSDLDTFDSPVLVLLDTYEQATTEVKEWISGPFLARAAIAKQVRVLIAGREIPNKINIEWGGCCRAYPLYGVREAEHWMPIVEAMHRRIPVDSPLSWLAGVCHTLQGRPNDIMKIIEGLPPQELPI